MWGGKAAKKKKIFFVVHMYVHTIYISNDVPPEGFFFPSYIHKIKTCTTYLKILLDFSMRPYNDLFDLISSLLKTHNQPSKQPPPPPFSSTREIWNLNLPLGRREGTGKPGKGGLCFRLTFLIYISYLHVHTLILLN